MARPNNESKNQYQALANRANQAAAALFALASAARAAGESSTAMTAQSAAVSYLVLGGRYTELAIDPPRKDYQDISLYRRAAFSKLRKPQSEVEATLQQHACTVFNLSDACEKLRLAFERSQGALEDMVGRSILEVTKLQLLAAQQVQAIRHNLQACIELQRELVSGAPELNVLASQFLRAASDRARQTHSAAAAQGETAAIIAEFEAERFGVLAQSPGFSHEDFSHLGPPLDDDWLSAMLAGIETAQGLLELARTWRS